MARGSAEVSRGGKLLGELRSDSFFGEIALVGATTRTARVACLEDTYLLVIPAAAVGDMAVKAPNLAKVLATHARTRLLSNVTRTSEIFRRLSSEEKRSLLPRFETLFAEDGDHLVRRGTTNESLFVLVSGQCEVRDEEGLVTTLGVGDGFGEMSMLGRKPATGDVVAIGSVVLLRVSRDMFDSIAMAHPELLAEVYGLLVARERENSDAIIHDADDLVI
jgi:cAMP-dependent protein kinase regulator